MTHSSEPSRWRRLPNPDHLARLCAGVSAWNAWRIENPRVTPQLDNANLSLGSLPELDLVGADLSGASLRHADLSGRRMRKTNLRRSDLGYALLAGVDLRDSDLEGASLKGARIISGFSLNREDLSLDPPGYMSSLVQEIQLEGGEWHIEQQGTNGDRNILPNPFVVSTIRPQQSSLRNANLCRADLRHAVIAGASLYGVNFEGARFGATTLACDVSGTLGLDAAEHVSSSQLSYTTLRSLPIPQPVAFMRGCGLNDWEIAAAKLYEPNLSAATVTDLLYQVHELRVDAPIQYYSVFISYSHDDKAFATKLYEALQANGIRCWFDKHAMLPGDDIYEQVDRGIALWDKLLLCCSKSSMTSWWVDNEIDSAFAKERRLMRERHHKTLTLIPLDLDGYISSNEFESGKKQQLLSRLAADFTCWQDGTIFDAQLARVMDALQLGNAARLQPPPPRL